MGEPKKLRCTCGATFATVKDGALVIESRHHGKVHVNTVSLARLRQVLAEAEAPEPTRKAS